MNYNDSVYTIKSLRKAALLCLKIALILGLIFSVLFNQFSLQGVLISILVSSLYSFGLGFGNGFLNNYLSSKWDWITQTNQRVWSGIIGTLVYTIIVVSFN